MHAAMLTVTLTCFMCFISRSISLPINLHHCMHTYIVYILHVGIHRMAIVMGPVGFSVDVDYSQQRDGGPRPVACEVIVEMVSVGPHTAQNQSKTIMVRRR